MQSVSESVADGIHAVVSRERMDPAARKLRDICAITPGAPILHREFGYYCLDAWHEQGLARDADLDALFGFDKPASHGVGDLGWCEAAFCPAFEDKLLENRGEYDVVQDFAGRKVLVFAGRRDGFMPTYIDHPVKDRATWEELCLWRLNPDTPERMNGFEDKMAQAKEAAARGLMVIQHIGGCCMYLRSLFGPEEIMFAFYDKPDLIHSCMQTWFTLADAVTAKHQQHITFDMVFFAEDICYNHGLLWSPAVIKEFMFPYYKQLLANIRSRQIDANRKMIIQIDTDGNANPAIPLFKEHLGMDMMSPFEVASGCDVVEIGRQYPDLIMTGGIDKRVLAEGKDAIDRMVDRIIPTMRERGGYYPTCDHGVPEEVSLDNYMHYRKRCLELGG